MRTSVTKPSNLRNVSRLVAKSYRDVVTFGAFVPICISFLGFLRYLSRPISSTYNGVKKQSIDAYLCPGNEAFSAYQISRGFVYSHLINEKLR